MAQMVKCKKCDTTYSAEFHRCPNCGSRKKTEVGAKQKSRPVVNVLVILAVVLALVISAYLVKISIDPSFSPVDAFRDMLGIQKEQPLPDNSRLLEDSFDPDIEGDIPVEEEPAPVEQTPPQEEKPPVVESIVLGQYDSEPLAVGGTVALSADVYPASSQQYLTWQSGDETIATVDDKGVVTAVAPGTVTITASALDKNTACIIQVQGQDTGEEGETGEKPQAYSKLTIYNIYQSAAVFPGEMSISRGEGVQMLLDGDGQKVTAGITWSVKDSGVATVSADGYVEGVGPGTTTIVASVGDMTAQCICRVN